MATSDCRFLLDNDTILQKTSNKLRSLTPEKKSQN